MTIDSEVRHVTKPGANLFLELGFSAAEAKKLHAASRQQINDRRLLEQHTTRKPRTQRNGRPLAPRRVR